jgi:hypothetical protein
VYTTMIFLLHTETLIFFSLNRFLRPTEEAASPGNFQHGASKSCAQM